MKLRTRKKKPSKGVQLKVDPKSNNLSMLKNCNFCAEECTSIEECARHIIKQHLLELKLCPRCSRAFTDRHQLEKHMERHRKRSYSIYSCSKCPIYYANHMLLEKHEFEKHEDGPSGLFLVRYYPYLSACVKMNFVRFYKRMRLNNATFRCNLCRKVATNLDMYIKHMKTECSRKQFVCDRCISVFPSRSTFTTHFMKNKRCQRQDMLSLVLNTKKKKIKCIKCKAMFSTRSQYETHFKLCTMKSYTCTDCDMSFRLMKDYHAHQSDAHTGPLELKMCKYCRMEFISEKSLERHMKQHERYSCLGCDLKFQYPNPLFHHIKTKHPDVEPYLCNICNIAFKDKVSFSLHIKEEHQNSGSIKFDDKFYITFSDNIQVRVDITEDSTEPQPDDESAAMLQFEDLEKDEKNITKADDPSASDSDQDLLTVKKTQAKRRGIMMAIKTFFCKFCGKRSASHDKYRKHIKGHFHSGVKQCMYCAKFFKNAEVLAEHVQENHKPGQARGTSKLRKLLQMRASKKMEALKAVNSIPSKNVKVHKFHNTIKKKPQVQEPEWPSKIKAIRVAEPTYDFLQSNPQVRTSGVEVSITFHKGSPPVNKIGDLTVQKYVEMFRPDVQPVNSTQSDTKLLTLNKFMKIKPVSPAVANKMFNIKMKKCNMTERKTKPGLAMPVRCKPDRSVRTDVSVRILEEHEVMHNPYNMNFGLQEEEPVIYEDFYNAEYFETDDQDTNVAQIEILSSNAGQSTQVVQTLQYDSGQEQYFIVEEAQPTTQEIETRLTEVCKTLEIPDNVQHIGGLMQNAPYFKIIDLKKQETNKKKITPAKVAYSGTVSFGGKKITLVNPLEHLLEKSNIKLKDSVPEKDYGTIIAKSLEKLGGQ